MGGKSGSTVIGYKYYFGIHMGISRGPVDELLQINVGDKPVWPTRLLEPDDSEDNFNNWTKITVKKYITVQFVEPVTPEPIGGVLPLPGTPGEGIIRVLTPNKWEVGKWVKLTGFKRISVVDQYDQPTPATEINLDGVYQVSYNGVDRDSDVISNEIRLTIPSQRYAEWRRFGPAYFNSPISDEFVLELVANQAGDPLTPVAGPGGFDDGVKESGVIMIEAPKVFGGETAEGGIEGPMNVMMGEPTQLAPARLVAMHGEELPGYRRTFTAFFDGMISAMNPYPKPWKFRFRRALKGWDGDVFMPDLAKIVLSRPLAEGEVTASKEIHAMNPAHIIFECLTNREWGRGLPRSALNFPAFEAAAGQLFSEGFGLCLRWTRSDVIETFVQSVLDHIGATLYQDAETTLLTLKLIRGGYDINALPLFEPGSGLLAVTDAPVAAAGSYINAVRVTYVDPLTGEDRTVQAQNLASIQAGNGTFNQQTTNYPGLPTAALAQRVAQRDLQTLGIELRKFTVQLDRRAYKVRPGDVIRIKDPSRSIRETLLRVTSYDDGTLQSGAIGIVGVQDIFDLPKYAYTGTQGSGWKPPTRKPCIARHEVFELPYVVYARFLSAADLAYFQETNGRYGTVVEQGQPGNVNYVSARRLGAPTPDDQPTTTSQYCGYVPPID